MQAQAFLNLPFHETQLYIFQLFID